jgi:hypothetical protein
VTVRFEVNEQGDTSEVEADGPSLLKQAVVQNVKNWKYSWNSPCPCRAKEKVIFKYILDDGTDVKGADLVVRWFGASPVTRIDVETGPIILNTDVNETKDVPKSR